MEPANVAAIDSACNEQIMGIENEGSSAIPANQSGGPEDEDMLMQTGLPGELAA